MEQENTYAYDRLLAFKEEISRKFQDLDSWNVYHPSNIKERFFKISDLAVKTNRCVQCLKLFTKKSNLKQHVRTRRKMYIQHTDFFVNKFLCNRCAIRR